MIAAIAALTLAVIAIRLDRRAMVLASEAAEAAAVAAKLADRAMSLASLATARVSSSRAERLADEVVARAASFSATTARTAE